MVNLGVGLIDRAMGKDYIGTFHYSLLSGGLVDGTLIKAVRSKVTGVTGKGLLPDSLLLTDIVTNAGFLRRMRRQLVGTGILGGPPNPNFAVKVGPGGSPGTYGVVGPRAGLSFPTYGPPTPHFAAKVA